MEFVIVRRFQNYFNAHIALTKLRDAGIACFLRDELTVTTDPILTYAVGGIKLVVPKPDELDALELLDHFDEEFRKQIACPRCDQKTIVRITRPSPVNTVTAILTWLLGSYPIAPETVYHCTTCGYESKSLPEFAPGEDE